MMSLFIPFLHPWLSSRIVLSKALIKENGENLNYDILDNYFTEMFQRYFKGKMIPEF